MENTTLKQQIKDATVQAMRDKNKERLVTIRLLSAEIKQYEVDNRVELGDDEIIAIIDKMVAKRKDASNQFKQANRNDLADKEIFEIGILKEFLPPALSGQEITAIIKSTIESVQASSIKDMGKVMAEIKPKIQGRADMSEVSKNIKDILSKS